MNELLVRVLHEDALLPLMLVVIGCLTLFEKKNNVPWKVRMNSSSYAEGRLLGRQIVYLPLLIIAALTIGKASFSQGLMFCAAFLGQAADLWRKKNISPQAQGLPISMYPVPRTVIFLQLIAVVIPLFVLVRFLVYGTI